jgi:hypothetical protein
MDSSVSKKIFRFSIFFLEDYFGVLELELDVSCGHIFLHILEA